jgi:hypothetical protein
MWASVERKGEMTEIAYKERRCGNCRYWAGNDFAVDGRGQKMRFDCRRYPPALISGKKRWPQTDKDKWCEEWQPRQYRRGDERLIAK